MQKKITAHYGNEVQECVKGITKKNFEDVVKCIANVKGITNPEVWIPEQIALFTLWSSECVL